MAKIRRHLGACEQKVLAELRSDPMQSHRQLAEATGYKITTVRSSIEILRKHGYIRGKAYVLA